MLSGMRSFRSSSRLATDHFLQTFRVPSPLQRNLRDGALDFAEIFRREFYGSCADIFFQARQLGRARDRNNPRLLSQQPSQRDLSRCRLLLFCELAKQINHGLICFPSLWSKARDDVAEIGTIELCVLVDLAGKEAFAKRTEWNESDPQFLECRYDFCFRYSPPQRVFALERCDRLHRVCATDCLHPCFRKPEVLHLALLDQVFHGSRHVFDGHVRVNTVLVEEIDDLGPEPLERSLGDLLDVRGPAIQPGLFAGVRIKFESELCGDHHLLTERSEGFTHEFFVCVRAVDFRCIEECDPAFPSCPDDGDHLLLVSGRAVAKAHSHTAESEGRNLQVAISKFAFLHWSLHADATIQRPTSASQLRPKSGGLDSHAW